MPQGRFLGLRSGGAGAKMPFEFPILRPIQSCLSLLAMLFFLPVVSLGQEPIDLFTDVPKLTNDYIRIGAWNLRHIDLENDTRAFLPGANDEEDFKILIATFAKAIEDLGLDLVAIVEHQPRANEPNRLDQLLNSLNSGNGASWKSDQTDIEYDEPDNPFSNLQFGLLWHSEKVTIDPNSDQLLLQLRQPRNNDGQLIHKRLRVPWLIPVQANQLQFDLLVLHLKSGGAFPQAQEVETLEQFINDRQSGDVPRHLVVCGDWNIRPDRSTGRSRLRQLMVPKSGSNLMRILTVSEIKPTLSGWEDLGSIGPDEPVASLVPFSHFNRNTLDTYLDHIAISRTLDEIFDHPVRVTVNGTSDLRPGIRIARPLIPEEDYLKLTDHLPVILTLRTTNDGTLPPQPTLGLRIVATIPNPFGNDVQKEQVSVKNFGASPQPLAGWKIGDAAGEKFWNLVASDGTVQPSETCTIIRQGRPMFLNNSTVVFCLLPLNGIALGRICQLL
jgi:endonuclease/exonuclease/phosphatase family metal-dependent hydrolase